MKRHVASKLNIRHISSFQDFADFYGGQTGQKEALKRLEEKQSLGQAHQVKKGGMIKPQGPSTEEAPFS